MYNNRITVKYCGTYIIELSVVKHVSQTSVILLPHNMGGFIN